MFVKDGEMEKVLVDTGATSHFVNDKSKFVDFDEDFNANVHVIKAKVNAKVKPYEVNHRSNGNALDVMLNYYNSALYVPTYQQSIFSVHAAVKRGASVSLGKDVIIRSSFIILVDQPSKSNKKILGYTIYLAFPHLRILHVL